MTKYFGRGFTHIECGLLFLFKVPCGGISLEISFYFLHVGGLLWLHREEFIFLLLGLLYIGGYIEEVLLG